ncbi:CDP-diacylglycerol--glycerol-3-phosphate 3-phosphatidyltransferase [Galdieria sulphuraria]|uniref:CDP-diacylglycerol--glycerol-3-phosphate 3-phosphatidyltransferase n=1 Tax=Galdieria sulphuraria TaxID=130081 RepID=M2XL08_GALSU|nr:CDP-diacylglycerol--glycerol-3-phosphate 3-phosphatidyltransferase [Galdieria sulphuraria]EME30817.1 CDP-diacylglycerol--glycerol-3-phosphate 3-phosphatidyltransferase [Galdieria sulphuraria]|eukprot:XP_005707337.1 CDP-diacylglycerol--glycerol-3-phosphate 3-phosphatidyltransferase [Galdieria sulphuraria]
MRTFCQQGESPSNPPGFEDNWIRREEAEIAALLEHDFRIDIDPRKIDWPPNELRYDPEELQRRYAPHISYDPVPLSSENLPILWDTPRVLSLLRLILYIPFVSFLLLNNYILCDFTLILSTWLLWLRKKSEAFVQCQATFLTFLEPLVSKSMFWSCLIGIAIQENSIWISTLIWLLVPLECFLLTLREWTTFCGRRFEAGYKANAVDAAFEMLTILLLHSSVYWKLWKQIGYFCLFITTSWRLWSSIQYALCAFEDRRQSEKRTMF